MRETSFGQAMIEQVTQYLVDLGVAPVVGGFVVGLVAGFLLRGLFRSATPDPAPASLRPTPDRPLPARHSLEVGVVRAFDALGVSAEEQEALAELARSDRALEAIKRLREQTRLGLKESKDLIDLLRVGGSR